jgi:hypothetical protein
MGFVQTCEERHHSGTVMNTSCSVQCGGRGFFTIWHTFPYRTLVHVISIFNIRHKFVSQEVEPRTVRVSMWPVTVAPKCKMSLQFLINFISALLTGANGRCGARCCPLFHICEVLKTHVDIYAKWRPHVITRQRASGFIIRQTYLFIKLTTVLAPFHYYHGLEHSTKTPRTASYTRITLSFLSERL